MSPLLCKSFICLNQDLCYLLNGVFSSLSDDEMDFDLNVTNIMPTQVTLKFVANFMRCYYFSCARRTVSTGSDAYIGINDTSVVIDGLAEATEYIIICNATRENDGVGLTKSSEPFTTG